MNWTNGNRIVFQISKSIKGFGKVYAVKHLEPETDEMQEWILRYGCISIEMAINLALDCAVKSDLISALRQEIVDTELFGSIASIIYSLLLAEIPIPEELDIWDDGGFIAGISEYEHAREALLLYLHHAKQHVLSEEHLCRT